jgi:excisionase family DNA binding protein
MTEPTSLEDFLSMTIRDACVLTGFSRDAIYDLINTGEVKSFLMGSRRYIDAASLRAYVAARAAEPVRNARSANLKNGPRGDPDRDRSEKRPRDPPT